MDEGTFRSGKQPDGSPIAHGITAEVTRLREQRDDLRRQLNHAQVQLLRNPNHATLEALQVRVAELELQLADCRRIHDNRVTGLLHANNALLERCRAAEAKLRENGIG